MLTILLLVVVVCACVGALPTWPHSREWGYGPFGGVLGVVLVVVLVLFLFGHRF